MSRKVHVGRGIKYGLLPMKRALLPRCDSCDADHQLSTFACGVLCVQVGTPAD